MNIRQYRREYARLHKRWELKARSIFYEALGNSIRPVLSSLNPDDLNQSVWVPAYKEVYSLIGKEAAANEYRQLRTENPIKADEDIVFFNENWRLLMERYGTEVALEIIADLNEATKSQIRKALAEAGANYATRTETARLILDYTMGDIGKMRALRIARTETTTAANKAKEYGAKTYFDEVGETQGYKMWISRADSKVRHDHMTVNDTAVPFDSVFNVGGFPAKLPGDNTLPAKERVNCRCSFVALSAAGYRRRFGNG